MIFVKEDYSLIRGALESWLRDMKDCLEDSPMKEGKAKEVVDESLERAERLIARIKTFEEKKP